MGQVKPTPSLLLAAPVAVAAVEEMMRGRVKSWELLVVLPVTLELEPMEVQRVQESPKLDREAEPIRVESILAEPVPEPAAAAANMGSKSSPRFFLGLLEAAVDRADPF